MRPHRGRPISSPATAPGDGPDVGQERADGHPMDALLDLVARLRDPEHGCPWDLKQNFRTVLPYTLEEAYEVAEAIEQDDMPSLREELGDLLFQVVLHAQMAAEQGLFDFADVIDGISDKMIRRHPHVFGQARLASEDAVHESWERTKQMEREAKGPAADAGLLDGVARALPGLVRAEKLQRRAARVGFDWQEGDLDGVAGKVSEELAECAETFASPAGSTERVHEIGDLLFSCVNLARHLGVDAEQALRAANHRFEWRFRQVEIGLRASGKVPDRAHREEMERWWERAKGPRG